MTRPPPRSTQGLGRRQRQMCIRDRRKGLRWRDIEVVHDNFGKPDLLLHNQAQRLLEAVEASRTWLSLSDERESALAVVVLEG